MLPVLFFSCFDLILMNWNNPTRTRQNLKPLFLCIMAMWKASKVSMVIIPIVAK